MHKLEEVFKLSGVPTLTFVEPTGFEAVKIALRTPGRGLVVEGPSGIGKSTAITRALQEIGLGEGATMLSARNPQEVDYISLLPEMESFGTVIVDDFHRLDRSTKDRIADLLKLLADREDTESKLIVIGINRAGESLVAHSPDLSNRIETIRFETEPARQIDRMVALGELALNIEISARDAIIEAAQGSFYIAQLLCFEVCLAGGITSSKDVRQVVDSSYSTARRKVMERQEGRFGPAVRRFARGTKFRPSGRAPYLHILSWLRDSSSWSILLHDEIARHPSQRISVSQVVDKGFLANLVGSDGIRELFHFADDTSVLSIEDPHLAYYLRNLDWPAFVRDVGFLSFDAGTEYDVALSFAGEDRQFAELLFDLLSDEQIAVFYDIAEQHRIVSRDVEDYLRPIYESGARYVVAVLGEQYGVKRWTLLESEAFRPRIDKGEVVPIWSTKVPPSAFDAVRRIGNLSYDPDGDLDAQARAAADVIRDMIDERDRQLRLGES